MLFGGVQKGESATPKTRPNATHRRRRRRRSLAPARVVRVAGVDVLPRDNVTFPSCPHLSPLATCPQFPHTQHCARTLPDLIPSSTTGRGVSRTARPRSEISSQARGQTPGHRIIRASSPVCTWRPPRWRASFLFLALNLDWPAAPQQHTSTHHVQPAPPL